jgi:hypothetical protein
LVDHAAADKLSRKRGRDAEFGDLADYCPRRQHVRWEWKGKTTAAAASWSNVALAEPTDVQLTAHTFKCRVVLQGPDVFRGMRALMEAGLMDTTATTTSSSSIPEYVRDAPMMGGTIRVDHGAVVHPANNENL